MDKKDSAAIEWAIKKHYKRKNDEELAKGLRITPDEVREVMSSLGLQRPKGNETLKDFARRYIMEMTEDEKLAFIRELPADLVWRMSEGNPHSTEDTTVTHILPQPILGGATTGNLGLTEGVKSEMTQ